MKPDLKYLSRVEAISVDVNLIDNLSYTLEELVFISASSIAEAVTKNFDLRTTIVSIWCGPGNNGADGLVLAQILASVGYIVEIIPFFDLKHKHLVHFIIILYVAFRRTMPPYEDSIQRKPQ